MAIIRSQDLVGVGKHSMVIIRYLSCPVLVDPHESSMTGAVNSRILDSGVDLGLEPESINLFLLSPVHISI